MNEFEATGFMVFLFVLRCVAPLVLMFAIGYFMNRMVDKWEREDQEAREKNQVGDALPIPDDVSPHKPDVSPQPAFTKPAPEKKRTLQLPCWLVKGCDPERRANCPACQQREKPCWVARLAAEGVLPSTCPDCPIYQTAHA